MFWRGGLAFKAKDDSVSSRYGMKWETPTENQPLEGLGPKWVEL